MKPVPCKVCGKKPEVTIGSVTDIKGTGWQSAGIDCSPLDEFKCFSTIEASFPADLTKAHIDKVLVKAWNEVMK